MTLHCLKCDTLAPARITITFFKVNPPPTDPRHPRWAFHLTAYCGNCDAYIKHLPQEVDTINDLKGATLIPLSQLL